VSALPGLALGLARELGRLAAEPILRRAGEGDSNAFRRGHELTEDKELFRAGLGEIWSFITGPRASAAGKDG
jgi:hypothetical protein